MSATPVRLSIIVPVYNNPDGLRECLAALARQSRPDSELLVVDDGSTDDTPAAAAGFGARMLRLPRNVGPAAARNHGARHARGEVLLFVDADVVLEQGAIERVLTTFEQHRELAAVFGSYDVTPRATGVVSRYRNLLHHFVHQNGQPEASTFWAGCGAVRRAVFRELGGFDAERFPRPSIEDIELGHRLHRAGHRILLDKMLQGTHLKRWSLRSVVHTDITRRALPWSRLTLENRAMPAALNLAWSQRLSAVLVAVACASLPLAAIRFELAALPMAALLAVLVLNWRLYRFFARRGGLGFAAACVALHFLYYVYSGLSYLFAWLEHRFGTPLATRHSPHGGGRVG